MKRTFIAPCIFANYRTLAEERYFRVVAQYGNNGPPKNCELSNQAIRDMEESAAERILGLREVNFDKEHQPTIVEYVVDRMLEAMRD